MSVRTHWKDHPLRIVLIALIVCYACLMGAERCEAAEGPSARPQILESTVCTARGTPLRGTTITTEGNEPGEFLMTGDEMRQLTENGLNALHIYAERRRDGKPIGASAENCDYLIAEAEKHNTVVVLTVGEFNLESEDIEAEIQFIYDFWEFYAARYGDRANVIFEICNEMPAIERSAEIEAHAYEIIRRHAPDTLVLFYSFALIERPDSILAQLEALEARIGDGDLWTNAALAFHAYECQEDLRGADFFRHIIHTLTREGYPIINTELPNRFELSSYPDTALLRVCEEERISWLSFVSWERITVPSIWRGQLEAAGIAWEPDFGAWPITDAIFPFKSHFIWETAESTPVEFVREHRFIAYKLSSGDFLALRRLHFGTRAPSALRAALKAEGNGILYVRAGGADGTLLGQCPIRDTEGQYVDVSVAMGASVRGLDDIFITFESDEDGRLYFKSWQFVLPEQARYTNPYGNTVFAADYPFSEGEIRRAASTDPASEAPLQVEGITDGSSLTFDFVEFHGNDALLHIRAMPLVGGSIRVVAGDQRFQVYPLSELEIDGESGVWAEYTCMLRQEEILMFDPVKQYLDLRLEFSGDGDKALFALSELWFEEI